MNFSSIFGGSTALMCCFIAYNVVPDRPFLTVYDMRYIDGQVIVEREIREPVRVADWRVTVVHTNDDSPTCQTVPGKGLHQGWSTYEPQSRKEQAWSVDVWVGDPGCYDRLAPGEHAMFVTWTPRDGSPTVTAMTNFVIEE